MKPHNIMEELVEETVTEIFSNKDYLAAAGCTSDEQCRLDVTCYVLNRIPPMYTTSGRGLAHVGKTFIDEPQSSADIAALVNEGIRKVGAHRRPSAAERDETSLPEPPMFNFPIIKGRVLDGKTFAPFTTDSISLISESSPVPMIDPTWNNPCPLVPETDGSFLFWPMPAKAGKPGESMTFSFRVEINAEGFNPMSHYFKLTIVSENNFIDSMKVDRIYRIEDIYLFPEGEPEDPSLKP